MGDEPEVAFWAVKIAKGESSAVVADFDDDQYETLHLTQVALGDAPAKGPHTVFVEQDGLKFAIGTLNRDNCCHFPIDITIATDSVSISHSGASEVFVTGYRTLHVRGLRMESDEEDDGLGRLMYGSGDSDESGESGSEGESDSEGESGSESEEEESEEEEDEAPRAVPLGNGVDRRASARGMLDAEAGFGSESEESGSEGDEEESEESSDEDADAAAGASSEDEESEEEAPTPAPAAAKRKAPAATAKTPQPAKRAKPDAPRAPASAPARVGAAAAAAATAPADAKAYEAALKAHIAAHGPATLAALGSAVKRPPAVPKLKGFLVQRAGVFKYDQAADAVSLA